MSFLFFFNSSCLSLLCDLFEPRYPFVRHEICLLLNKIRKIAMSIVHWPHAPKIQPKIQSKHKIIMNSSICDVIHQFLLKYLHQINALTLFLFIPNILNYIQVQWISHSCTKNQSMWIGPFVAVCLSCDSFVVVCRFHCNFQTIQIKSNWIEFHLIH